MGGRDPRGTLNGAPATTLARVTGATTMPATMPSPMPAAFIGHGSPMNALERNRYTEAWRALGAALPRPRAVLVVSAHWYINCLLYTSDAADE